MNKNEMRFKAATISRHSKPKSNPYFLGVVLVITIVIAIIGAAGK